ncbi:MAG: redoxin domain-containing protein [Candidatus Latescibacteria bacterium]|nr:redoxin domain-containing protein [Candidatus Latescibacterota bacterium]NIO57363.1 redoxin domain-containing protein [Candidatus Latescibacterota bacterium]
MSHLITKEAPDFKANAVMEDDRLEPEFTLSSLRGNYVILFFYPLDFTFVCLSEILAFDEKLNEFKARDAAVVGVSVDSAHTHLAWKKTPVEKGGIGPIRYPLVSDLKKDIARSYGVLLDDEVALRGLFLIDRQGIVRHAVLNDLPLGRSVAETLRMLDALRYYEERGRLCPANWEKGEEGMEGTAEGVIDYLSKYAKK